MDQDLHRLLIDMAAEVHQALATPMGHDYEPGPAAGRPGHPLAVPAFSAAKRT